MKKVFTLLPIIGMLAYITLSSYSSGPSTGSVERTGSSGPTGCSGSGCHGSSTGVTVGIQLLSGTTPVSAYTPGTAYTIRMTGTYTSSSSSAPSLPKYGFQLSAIKTSTTTNSGTWGASLPASTHTATVGVISVVEQTSPISATTGGGAPGSTYVIDIPWTAPVAGTGSITINGVMNAVDGGGSADAADRSGNGTLTATEATATTAPITGILQACIGTTTALADATTGGTWSSGNVAVATVVSTTGVVTGVAAGTATISYTVGSSAPATAVVTVFPAPAPITGTATLCVGATTTLSSTVASGSWISSNLSIATVTTGGGVVTGVSAGVVNIDYTVPGCFAVRSVTVNAAGAAPIAGSHTVCVGTTTTLTNLTPGGTWTSSVPAKATVGTGTGLVTGVAVGTTMISYTATNSCGSATTTHSINVLAAGLCTSAVDPVTTDPADYLSIYPNPSTGTFTINMVSGITETVHIKVLGLSGNVIKDFTTSSNGALEVSIPRTVGMYFVIVNSSTGNYVSKLMVQ